MLQIRHDSGYMDRFYIFLYHAILLCTPAWLLEKYPGNKDHWFDISKASTLHVIVGLVSNHDESEEFCFEGNHNNYR